MRFLQIFSHLLAGENRTEMTIGQGMFTSMMSLQAKARRRTVAVTIGQIAVAGDSRTEVSAENVAELAMPSMLILFT